MKTDLTLRALTLALLTCALTTSRAHADWIPNGTPVCTAAGDQRYAMPVPDGQHGSIVVWEDKRAGNYDIYAQHLKGASGVDPAWPANGVAVCTATGEQGDYTGELAVASDGAGGAIATWMDLRSGTADIYAQHVRANGTVDPAWPANGRAINTSIGAQRSPAIVADGIGGAIISWYDMRSDTADIYSQHVLASGALDPAWPAAGLRICGAVNAQYTPVCVSDGAGGAIVAWLDLRSGTDFDPYVQHVLIGGTVDPAWPVNGRALVLGYNYQYNLAITTDGAGGAIVAWEDYRSTTNYKIMAGHVTSAGVTDPAWPLYGQSVASAVGNQNRPSITTDMAGGAIISWWDFRAGGYPTSGDIYAHRILADGTMALAWGISGRAICTATGNQTNAVTESDGSGGAYIAWGDARAGGVFSDLYVQHVLGSSAIAPGWPTDGEALCSGGTAGPASIVTDGSGGALLQWYDWRNSPTVSDLYARRFSSTGLQRINVSTTGSGSVKLAVPTPAVTAFVDVTQYDSAPFLFEPAPTYAVGGVNVNLTTIGVPPNYTFTGVTTGQQLSVNFSTALWETQPTTPIARSYVAFGIPTTFANDSVSTLFAALGGQDDKVWRLAHWDPASNSYAYAGGALKTIRPGDGYWMITASPVAVSLLGTPLAASSVSVDLLGDATNGWNQIANPFRFAVSDTALWVNDGTTSHPLIDPTNTLCDSVLWEWTGGSSYVPTHTVQPLKSYWVHKKVAGTARLFFPNRSSTRTVTMAPVRPADAEWALALTARQGESHSSRAVVGTWSTRQAAEPLRMDAPPASPGGELSLVVLGEAGTAARQLTQFVPATTTPSWTIELSGASVPGEVQLDLEGFGLPAGTPLVLTDSERGWQREVHTGETVNLAAFAGTRRLTLSAGVPLEAAATTITMHPMAYPNPFRQSTGLLLALPRPGAVSVDIYDVHGRLVQHLSEPAFAAGEHVVTWDGRDRSGTRLGPGVYLARYHAGETTGTARLVKLD